MTADADAERPRPQYGEYATPNRRSPRYAAFRSSRRRETVTPLTGPHRLAPSSTGVADSGERVAPHRSARSRSRSSCSAIINVIQSAPLFLDFAPTLELAREECHLRSDRPVILEFGEPARIGGYVLLAISIVLARRRSGVVVSGPVAVARRVLDPTRRGWAQPRVLHRRARRRALLDTRFPVRGADPCVSASCLGKLPPPSSRTSAVSATGWAVAIAVILATVPVTFIFFEIESQAFLVSGVDSPGVVRVALWKINGLMNLSVRIALEWRFNLDDLGSKIGKDCRRSRGGNEACAINDAQA